MNVLKSILLILFFLTVSLSIFSQSSVAESGANPAVAGGANSSAETIPDDIKAQAVAQYLPLKGSYGSIELGDSRQAVLEKIVKKEADLEIDEESIFWTREFQRSNIIKAQAMPYIVHIYFYFDRDDYLYQIIMQFNRDYYAYSDLFQQLRKVYRPELLIKQEPMIAVWETKNLGDTSDDTSTENKTSPTGDKSTTTVGTNPPIPPAENVSSSTSGTPAVNASPATEPGKKENKPLKRDVTKVRMILNDAPEINKTHPTLRMIDLKGFAEMVSYYEDSQESTGDGIPDFVRQNPRRQRYLNKLMPTPELPK